MMMGIIGMIVFQDLQNIGMILGILPITGITLPLYILWRIISCFLYDTHCCRTAYVQRNH
ncbi:FtsW/RodA/SpoVE family cell cycle protein [Erysipelothrix piscisicarius]|uniref:FtsW/RodA/SpoVE family cell cycle protein n=1 Tax=Erysipelothrix piscisicarius TaxID=2485784 RepID=UPI002F957152